MSAGNLVFLDTETTGLDPVRHEVWELAYAVEDAPVISAVVPHSLRHADPVALRMNGYAERVTGLHRQVTAGVRVEQAAKEALQGATLVAANPAFDAGMLAARWGVAPWHYRLLDVEAYAMGVLGYARPEGLKTIAAELVGRGYKVPAPDHSAAADVRTLRACFTALRDLSKGGRQ